MNHIISAAVQLAQQNEQDAWSQYMAWLGATYSEDCIWDDDELAGVIATLKLLPITLADAIADLRAVQEKRHLEAQIEMHEATIDAGHQKQLQCQKQKADMDADQKARGTQDMKLDYRTPHAELEHAQRACINAGRSIDVADARLKALRLERPRAFGVCAELEALVL